MGGVISDITYEDIVIRGRVNHWQSMPSSPIRMAMFYHAADLNATHGEFGVIANLTFRNIVAEAAPMAGCAWHDGKPPAHGARRAALTSAALTLATAVVAGSGGLLPH